MNAGIIVAGGAGNRFGSYKQTAVLNNKPVYEEFSDIKDHTNIISILEGNEYIPIPKYEELIVRKKKKEDRKAKKRLIH